MEKVKIGSKKWWENVANEFIEHESMCFDERDWKESLESRGYSKEELDYLDIYFEEEEENV